MSIELRWPLGPRWAAVARFTDRLDGDFHVDGEPVALGARRQAVAPLPWTWLRQVHGSQVVVVTRPGEGAGREADAAVTATGGAALAVQAADCAPVVLIGDGGVVGVAHAGWRGVRDGVLAAAAEEMRGLGATDIRAVIGPCIEPSSYEFGTDLLGELAGSLGSQVRARTRDGRPALDLTAAVAAGLAAAGVTPVERIGGCTAGQPSLLYSHRARGERGRQAAVVWLESPQDRGPLDEHEER